MKKYLFIAAAATLFAACSQEDVLVEEQPQVDVERAIGFGTITSNITRAENSDATGKTGLETYHSTFRVWGYKNIQTTETDVYDNSVVFAGTDDKSKLTWTTGLAAPFNSSDWKYTPIRYWDKTATNYEFHAAAPADPATGFWTWNQTNPTDGKGAGYFTTTNFTVKGESLPFATEVTGQPDDVFGKGDTKDIDLMIATDVTEYVNFPTTEHVHFDFNHILSRLNIAVRTTVKKTSDAEGVVTLESVKVYNLLTTGKFNESTVTGDELAAGTSLRWEKTSDKGTFGFPNTEVTADDVAVISNNASDATDNDKTGVFKYVFQGLVMPQDIAYRHIAVDGSDLNTSTDQYLEIKYDIDGEKFVSYYNLADIFTSNTQYKDSEDRLAYKTFVDGTYVFVDGTNYFDKDGNQYDNSKIAFLNQENGTFSKVTDAPLYEHEGKLYTDPATFDETTEFACSVIILRENGELLPVMRSEVAGAQNISFNEGWQNNLKITISPTAILFDADVFEWATNEDAEEVIE